MMEWSKNRLRVKIGNKGPVFLRDMFGDLGLGVERHWVVENQTKPFNSPEPEFSAVRLPEPPFRSLQNEEKCPFQHV